MENTIMVEILTEAKSLLMKGWCQRVDAIDTNGVRSDALDRNACKWCLTGALARSTYDYHMENPSKWMEYLDTHGNIIDKIEEINEIENKLCNDPLYVEFWYNAPVPVWNDQPHRTKQEVLDLIDNTINKLKN